MAKHWTFSYVGGEDSAVRNVASWMRVAVIAAFALGCTRGDAPESEPDSGTRGQRDAGGTDAAPVGDHDGATREADSSVPDAGATPEADSGAAEAGDAGDAGTPDGAGPGSSQYCGDALRDPIEEECDDGAGQDSDACTASCRARSVPAVSIASAAGATRHLGAAAHVASAGERGFAVVLVEASLEASVLAQRFDANGQRNGAPVELGVDAVAAGVPEPALAVLPGGDYAVAWTDVGAGSPDIVLRKVNALTGSAGPLVVANSAAGGPQQDVDVVWTGTRLAVAWTDLFDVFVRRFDADLEPLGGDELVTEVGALDTAVTLEPFAGDVALAWRSADAGLERVLVQAGGVRWWSRPARPSAAGDRPALVALDEAHLLLLYTAAEDDGGLEPLPSVHAAVLDLDEPGEIADVPLQRLAAPEVGGAHRQRRPRATRVEQRLYVAWENEHVSAEGSTRDVVLQEALVASGSSSVEVVREWLLPIDSAASEDAGQRNPALASSPLSPEGGVICGWEQSTDVMIALRPSPIVELR